MEESETGEIASAEQDPDAGKPKSDTEDASLNNVDPEPDPDPDPDSMAAEVFFEDASLNKNNPEPDPDPDPDPDPMGAEVFFKDASLNEVDPQPDPDPDPDPTGAKVFSEEACFNQADLIPDVDDVSYDQDTTSLDRGTVTTEIETSLPVGDILKAYRFQSVVTVAYIMLGVVCFSPWTMIASYIPFYAKRKHPESASSADQRRFGWYRNFFLYYSEFAISLPLLVVRQS